MHPPLTRIASPAAPAVAAAPEALAPARRSARPSLRGGTISSRAQASCARARETPPLCPAREEGPRPPRSAPCDPNAGTLRGVNAFVAGGVRPGGSCSSGSWPTPRVRAALGSPSEPSARAEGRARLRLGVPADATAPRPERACALRARPRSRRLRAAPQFRRRNRSETRAGAPPSAPRRVGGGSVPTLSKEDKRREAAETLPFRRALRSSPRRAGTRRTSCWTTRPRTRGVWGAIRAERRDRLGFGVSVSRRAFVCVTSSLRTFDEAARGRRARP